MNLPLFISRRIYAQQGERRKVSRPAIRVATIGVAVGLAVMLISVSVVFGFKHTIRDKVVGFGSHLQVAEFSTLQAGDNQPIAMPDSMLQVLRRQPGVSHVSRYALRQGILKTDTDFLGVAFKGIAQDYDTTFIHQHLVAGTIPHFTDSTSSSQIVVSQLMAQKLRLKCGDRLFAYFIDGQGVRTRRFTITGIYETNLTQYDRLICLTDLHTVIRLNRWQPDQVTGAEISVSDYSRIDETERSLVTNVNRTLDHYGATYTSKTIRDINPQIFSWLDLLDLNVWIILAIMTAVAAVTMISGLLIIILERTAMIGVLKALGARNCTIRHTFLWFAFFIIGKGLLWGDILGIGLIALQKATGIVHLDPASYYVDTVPVEFNWGVILLLNVATMIVSLLVLIVPSFLVSHIHPAKSMRYE